MTLIAVPDPVDDETLPSQLRRIAGANGLPTVHRLNKRVHRQRDPEYRRPGAVGHKFLIEDPDPDWLHALAELAGVDAGHCAAGTLVGGRYPSLRTALPRNFHRLGMYCPVCLELDGAWRLQWLLPYVNACSLHDVLLVDHLRGPRLRGHVVQWVSHTGPFVYCYHHECDTDLLNVPAIRAPTAVLDEQEHFIDLDLRGRIRRARAPKQEPGPNVERRVFVPSGAPTVEGIYMEVLAATPP